MAWDPTDDSIVFADQSSMRLRRIFQDASGFFVVTVAGNGVDNGVVAAEGPSLTTPMSNPRGVAITPGGVIFVSGLYSRIWSISGGFTRWIAGAGAVCPSTGQWQACGDGSKAIHATMGLNVMSLAYSPNGNLFVAEPDSHVVRVLLLTTRNTTAYNNTFLRVAGGAAGFSGDGGPAFNALLNFPWGIAFDERGGLYVGDYNNLRIRYIGVVSKTPSATATPSATVAAAAAGGYASGSIAAGITTRVGNGVATYAASDHGALAQSVAVQPSNLAFHAATQRLFISQSVQNVIRVFHLANSTVRNFAGTGVAGSVDGPALIATLNAPRGMCMDAGGKLWIAEHDAHKIRVVLANGTLTTVAGTGAAGYGGDKLANISQLYSPYDVAIDPVDGQVVVADFQNYLVRKFMTNSSGTFLARVAGSNSLTTWTTDGPALRTAVHAPSALAFAPSGALYVAVYGSRILRVDRGLGGTFTWVASVTGTGSSSCRGS
jgi:sugar lactone lactonase YvrE